MKSWDFLVANSKVPFDDLIEDPDTLMNSLHVDKKKGLVGIDFPARD